MKHGRTAAACLLLAAGASSADTAATAGIPGNLVVDGVPPLPAALSDSLRRYQNTRGTGLSGWMDDGILIGTRFANTSQLHRVDSPLGMRRQITFFDEPVGGASINPGARSGFAYFKDIGGSEFYQLFWHDAESGETAMLSDGKSRYMGASWSPSGERLGYATTAGNGVDWDLHIADLGGGRTVLQEGEGVGWGIEHWSGDESRILASRYVSINESELYEFVVATGERRRLLADTTAAIGGAGYGADGGIYFTSDMDGEFMRLHRLDAATGAVRTLTADTPWNVETFALSRDRTLLAYVFNEDGMSRLEVRNLASGALLALPDLPPGIISGLRFKPDGTRLGFTLRSATTPADVFSIDLGPLSADNLVRWTEGELGNLRRADLAAPETIRYESFDGREIPALVYRPAGPGPHPVLISIHGGPEGQSRPSFSPTIQFYVKELGIAVIQPNVRGSSGYGKSYLLLDNGRKREDSVRDIGALLDWVDGQRDLDSDRVAVTGGSYGGYMVLATLVHYGDRLRAAMESVGISNFVTFLRNTQPYRQDLRRAEYGDERDESMREFLESISPLNHVEKIRTPLLVSQGLNDPRVPASESEQIVAALRARDVPVWYVLAEDEGHGFRKKDNRDYLAAAAAMFLRERLLGDG